MSSIVFSSMNARQKAVDFLLMLFLVGFLLLVIVPKGAFAASPEVAGWIPWWTEEEGIKSAEEHIRDLDVIFPFTIEVNPDGTLKNRVNFHDRDWRNLFRKAERYDVEVIPTVMWFEGEQIHAHLSDRKLRKKHIDAIVDFIDDNDFAGVNIDYEQKWSETKDDFSIFLRDLKDELEDEVGRGTLLTCTVEARMEPDHRWRDVPSEINYANDYEAMNKYCDRVEIMAYDQQRADLVFNDLRKGVPYAPVADTDWVKHVVDFALEDFDADKVYLGVATYGRAWDVTVAPDWYKGYTRVASLNQPRILELANDIYKVPIGRTEGGEAVISYFPEDSPYKVFNALPTPEGTPKGFEAAAKALMVANFTKVEIPVRVVFWNDAKAINEKLQIVEDKELAGVAIFKIDGEEDPNMWDLF